MKLITADQLNYQICPYCSHDNYWIYHPNGKCPKNTRECFICKETVNDLNSICLGYGSQYDGEHVCYKCLDRMITEKVGL